MTKKQVRFCSEAVKEDSAPELSILEGRASPIESINLEDYLFSSQEGGSIVKNAFSLRLHLGVVRTSHTYLASVEVASPFPVTIDSILPTQVQSLAELSQYLHESPAEAVPDVCATFPAHQKSTTGYQDDEENSVIHFLVTPKTEGMFSFSLKLPVKEIKAGSQVGHLEVKILGNSLDVSTGKPSVREGVKLVVPRFPSTDSHV
eukprot:Protomagalhaensia_sp_Gyna_25__5577@NODE_765_length_2661_cov_8_701373_g600_i0_p2_GENE_NODE_765_length_2661_cov_8_701373_g600_i0NODE_765_length_2661_cov_8_701373_g600_i0_p2_ORF_typecomplete_len204_score27_84DUF4517/PF15006_6/4_3e05_NODE_765_length_2661_cov_8_701373_g600_i010831694